jgi:iron complex transport system permease protein
MQALDKNKLTFFLTLGVCTLIALNLVLGPADIGWDIVLNLRVPRTLVALVAGALLALNGLMLQNWLHNPLAAPYVLGIESLSTLGILLWMMAMTGMGIGALDGLMTLSFAGAGFISSLMGMILLLALFRLWGKASFVLMVGLLLGGLVSGFTNMLTSMIPIERIKGLYFWGMGSFENVYGTDLLIFSAVMFISFFMLYYFRKSLSTLALGEMYAKAIGMNTKRTINVMMLLVCIGVGTITAYCGPISFISIIAPFIARKGFRFGSFQRLFIPTALIGSTLALMAQLLSSSMETGMPLNAALGLMGFPILIWMIWNSRREIVT